MTELEMNGQTMPSLNKHRLANKIVTKMNGLGNEILILDLRGAHFLPTAEEVRAIGHGEGLHFDQLMVVSDQSDRETEAFMTIYNIDGSEAGACGNGTRCVAWWMLRNNARDSLVLETAAIPRLICRRVSDDVVNVVMGTPRFEWQDIPLKHDPRDTSRVALEMPITGPLPDAVLVDMGNPHAVFFLPQDKTPDAKTYDLGKLGPLLEKHPIFPDRANISFARVLTRDHIELNVWERGAGLTQACGSAACATLVAAVRRGLTGRTATVTLPGGDLEITWRESDDKVEMTGPIEFEYDKELSPGLFEDIAA